MKFLVFSIFFFNSILFFSQEKTKEVYHSLGRSKEQQEKSKNTSDNYLCVKFDIIDPVMGRTGVFVEKNISSLFGVEVGAGVTFGSSIFDYVRIASNTKFDGVVKVIASDPPNLFYNYNDPGIEYYENMPSSLSYHFSIFPKFYIEHDPHEDFFIGIKAGFQKYKYNTSKIINFSELYFQPHFGWKHNIYRSKIYVENSVGVGVSFVNDQRTVQSAIYTFSKVRPDLNLCFKFCYVVF